MTFFARFDDLTLPDRFSRAFAFQAVESALVEFSRALYPLAHFALVPELPDVAKKFHIVISFGQAAQNIAELATNSDGSHVVVLDRDANWNICRGWFKRRAGSVPLELLIWHELGHIAGSRHSRDPDSIMFPTPSFRKRLTDADSLQLKMAFSHIVP